MTPNEMAKALAAQADKVARELLPNGKNKSGEWCVGSVDGEPGESMKVCTKGEKAGIWSDFATGEGGDLIDLWRITKGLNASEAFKQIKNYLGVSEPNFYQAATKKKNYTKPVKPKCSAKAYEIEWLKGRGLSEQTLQAFKIAGSNGKVYFPFIRDGETIMIKWRSTTSKDTAPTSKNQEPILFGWQAVPDNCRTIAICEGEIDAMSLFEVGIPALSVPFGGGTGAKQQWIEHEFDNLERFDEIFVCMDSDKVGREAAKEIIERLGRHRCKLVNLPAKDANDCLQQGVPVSMIKNSFANAVTMDPSELRCASSFRDEILAELFPSESEDDHALSLLGNKHPENFCFRQDEIIAVTGTNGHGKSEWLGHLIVEGAHQGFRWCVASMELKPGRLLGRRMAKQAAGLGQPSLDYSNAIIDWFDERLWIFDATGSVKQDRILEVFEYAFKRYGVTHFVIDSLMMCGIADDDYSGQKDFLLKIRDFKSQFNVTVFVVMHPRKLEDETKIPGKFDVLGGISITNLIDTGLSVWRNKAKEEARQAGVTHLGENAVIDLPDTLVKIWKQRNGDGWEGTAAYWFDIESKQFRTSSTSKPFHYVKYTAITRTA